MQRELAPLCEHEKPGTLGGKICQRIEYWGKSALRHCVYPANGSCTEHTDYGLLTLQHSTCPGFEAFLSDQWRSVQPPDGCAVLYVGDMFERITNGRTKAVLHRVCLDPSDYEGT